MLMTRIPVWMFPVVMTVMGAGAASGQDYPSKPIRVITNVIGGANDSTARLIGPGISATLGQPVIIDNRATSMVGELVSKAPPDGYTLMLNSNSFYVTPLFRKAPFDPVRDFAPISLAARLPLILYVSLSLPVKSVKELIALAKARPGELNNSHGPVSGGAAHLAGELFKSMAGVNIVGVPYSSQSSELADLLTGRIHLTFTGPAALMEHVKLGKLRALAVTSTVPSPVVPGLPTVAASLPGYEAAQIIGIFAPSKTPEAIIKRLNQEVVRFLQTPGAKEKFLTLGYEIVGSPPEVLAATVKSEMAMVSKLIKDLGIKPE